MAGTTKTRLIPALGADGAAALHRRMAEELWAMLTGYARQNRVQIEVCFDGADAAALRRWLPGAAGYTPQGEGDLGKRMRHAFDRALTGNDQPVLAIGSDCPALSPLHLTAAISGLHGHDLVLGPALDGGYYLIGLNRPKPLLFAEINWGSGMVLSQTMARAEAMGLNTLLLEPLPDVDRPEDLAHLGDHPNPQ